MAMEQLLKAIDARDGASFAQLLTADCAFRAPGFTPPLRATALRSDPPLTGRVFATGGAYFSNNFAKFRALRFFQPMRW